MALNFTTFLALNLGSRFSKSKLYNNFSKKARAGLIDKHILPSKFKRQNKYFMFAKSLGV
jgi:hypothetical protein